MAIEATSAPGAGTAVDGPVAEWVTIEQLDRDPYPVLERLRAESPVAFVPALDRWVVAGYDDTVLVETDPERYTSVRPGDRLNRTLGHSMIRKDNPEHGAERRAASPALRIKAAQGQWKPVFLANAERFLADLQEHGPGADLTTVFAEPFATANVAAVVGLASVPVETVARWSRTLMAGAANYLEDPTVWARVAEVGVEIDEALEEVVPRLRRSPDGSVASAMLEAGMTLEIVRANVKLALSGGINEPKHTITSGIWAFDRHPDQLERLLGDPTRFEAAFDEVLRWAPPITMGSRHTTQEVHLRGVRIPADQMVGPAYLGANRDPRRFDDPARFDIDRTNQGHLAFGIGPHMCAGRWVAQSSVAHVAWPLLYARLPGLAPADPDAARFEGLIFRGLHDMPVTWDTTAARSSRHRSIPGALDARAELEVVAIDPVADSVVHVTLAPVDGAPAVPWTPGAHLGVHLPNGLERHYSLCNRGDDRTVYEIAVLREPGGRGGSEHLHTAVRVGDRITASPPRSNFAWSASPRYRFVAGGIGITPLLPMIAAATRDGADWSLLYLGRDRPSMAFADELEALGDHVTIWPKAELGRADLDALVPAPDADTLVFACGPTPLLDELEAKAEHWPSDRLRVERFVARAVDDLPNEPVRVHLARSGRVVEVPAGRTILEALEDAGVPVASSCLEGTCRTCETRVLAGTPCHRDAALSPAERRAGETMMVCVSRASTPELTLDR